MTQDEILAIDAIDVNSHRNPKGELYYPSQPWGIHVYVVNFEPTNGGANVSTAAKTKREATEKGQRLHGKLRNAIVLIFDRRTGKIVHRIATPTIPPDFPVQPLKPGQEAKDKATCGNCGLSWDDAIPTTWTPAPSARCPFEHFHVS